MGTLGWGDGESGELTGTRNDGLAECRSTGGQRAVGAWCPQAVRREGNGALSWVRRLFPHRSLLFAVGTG